MSKKPRADSQLKTLPAERQDAIIAHMRDHKLTETRTWLRDDGLETSERALSDFWSWYHLEQQLRRNESRVETLVKRIAERRPELSQENLFDLGQEVFSAMAIEEEDAKSWFLTQQLNLKREDQALAREKLELLKRKADQADQAKQVMDDQTITPEEQRARLREILK